MYDFVTFLVAIDVAIFMLNFFTDIPDWTLTGTFITISCLDCGMHHNLLFNSYNHLLLFKFGNILNTLIIS